MFAALRARRSSGSESDRRRAALARRRWLGAGLIVGLLAFATLALLTSGGFYKIEFDPHTLSVRRRIERYYLFETIGPIPAESWRDVTAEFPTLAAIRAAGHVTVREDAEPRWLVVPRQGGSMAPGMLRPLYYQKVADWTERYPEPARVWWRRGFALLRSDDPAERRAGRDLLAAREWGKQNFSFRHTASAWDRVTAAEMDATVDALLDEFEAAPGRADR